MALQENWSLSHLLLPACPQSSNGERENIVSTTAFVAHFLSNTTCNESQSFITHTDLKSVYKQISNRTWTDTYSQTYPQILMKCNKAPSQSPKGQGEKKRWVGQWGWREVEVEKVKDGKGQNVPFLSISELLSCQWLRQWLESIKEMHVSRRPML